MMFQSGRFKRLFVRIFTDVFPPIASEMRRSQPGRARHFWRTTSLRAAETVRRRYSRSVLEAGIPVAPGAIDKHTDAAYCQDCAQRGHKNADEREGDGDQQHRSNGYQDCADDFIADGMNRP